MSYKQLVQDRRKFLKHQVWRTRLVLWLGALLIGLVATSLAIAGDQSELLFKQAIAVIPYLPLLLTPIGFVVITWITNKYLSGAQGSGIPQTIAALNMKNHKQRSKVLSFPIAFGKAFLILLGLLCGASIGRGGPTIHIGAAIAYALSRFARFPYHEIGRGLILAGAAAGLTAAFNTPLAGIMFTIEEMTRNYEEKINRTIIVVVIIASIMYMSLLGNFRYIGHVSGDIASYATIYMVLICGIIGGTLGGLFTFILIRGSCLLSPVRQQAPYLFALFCGLIVAFIGISTDGESFGTGYFEIQRFLSENNSISDTYPLTKLMATVVSYWSGIPGGIFTPTLSIGAGIGAELAQWFHGLPFAIVILLAMAAYFTGVMQTPITAAILIVEMTGDIELFLPLLAATITANSVSRYFNNEPIYRALAAEFLRNMKLEKH
ncbi:MAG: chloride channel protein [Pseudomonadota bacterium]